MHLSYWLRGDTEDIEADDGVVSTSGAVAAVDTWICGQDPWD